MQPDMPKNLCLILDLLLHCCCNNDLQATLLLLLQLIVSYVLLVNAHAAFVLAVFKGN